MYIRRFSVGLILFFLLCINSFAQERSFRYTISVGSSLTAYLTDVKQPGYSGRLWVEKLVDRDEARALWFALEHTNMWPAATRTELWDPTGTTTVTKTFHASSITTLTFGARKWQDNNIVWGLGSGIGIYSQGYPFFKYSEDILNYVQYQKRVTGWGWATAAQIGYKPGNFQITLNYHGVLDFFRTIDLSDEYDRARSSSVLSLGLSLGYTF